MAAGMTQSPLPPTVNQCHGRADGAFADTHQGSSEALA